MSDPVEGQVSENVPDDSSTRGVDREQPDSDVLESVFGANTALAEQYADVLADRGIEWGLVGPHEVSRLWSRHILNSVAPADLMPAGASVVDVGSGAGMPGIPLALARPDLRITLLEPLERRYEFLLLAIDELGLGERIQVQRVRSEDCRERFDVVTSRAVAPLPRLLRDQWHLREAGGLLLAIKGASAPTEISKARTELTKRKAQADVLQVRAHPRSEPTSVVRVRGL